MGEARTVILNDPALRNFNVKPHPRVAKTLAVEILGAALAGGAFLYSDGPMRLLANARSGTGEMPTIELADGTTLPIYSRNSRGNIAARSGILTGCEGFHSSVCCRGERRADDRARDGL